MPINRAESIVKIYACKKATRSSINVKKNDRANERTVAPAAPKVLFMMIAIEIRLITTIWPAEIFANKRIISENGFVRVPSNSIGAKIIFIGTGTPGIQKMCFQ